MAKPIDAELAAKLIHLLEREGGESDGAKAMIGLLRKVLPRGGAAGMPIDPMVAAAVAGNPGPRTSSILGPDGKPYTIQTVTPQTWFGPAQPIMPMADRPEQGATGRRFDFPVGSNINPLPKSEWGAGVSFAMLRALGDAYDLLRLVIETRKDQISSINWNIVPKDPKAKANQFADQIKRATAFLERPNHEQNWPEFLKAILEDDLVCGGITLFPRLNRGGGLYGVYPVDVTTIKRLIDEHGLTPLPPSPAYQQNLKGIPATDLTTNQLFYWMRNPRTSKLYGLGPVEQILVTVNIALRRQQFQLEYYTDGSIPDALLGVSDAWTPDQIKEFQQQFDDLLSGQTAVRRRIKFMPEVKTSILPKDASVVLKDEFDEWLARLVCFCFSVSPSALLKMVNRASGEQIAETAKEEGLIPVLSWYAVKFTELLNGPLACPDVKFAWETEKEVDPQIRAEIRKSDVYGGVISVDEAREELGKEPWGGAAAKPMVITATGPVPLLETIDDAVDKIKNPPPPPPTMAGVPAQKPAADAAAQGGGGGEVQAKPKADEKPQAKKAARGLLKGAHDALARAAGESLAGGTLRIYSGRPGADATLLATVPIPTRFELAEDGQARVVRFAAFNAAKCIASGKAGWFRGYSPTSNVPIVEGTVGKTDSGADLVIDEPRLFQGMELAIDEFRCQILAAEEALA